MKKVLFIIPTLAAGGTNSSLSSYYSLLKEKYDIRVFPISHIPFNCYVFDKVLIRQHFLLTCFFANFYDLSWSQKIPSLFLKSFGFLFRFFGVNFGDMLCKSSVRRLEKGNAFDCVVGFEEGRATRFASLFKTKNKIAWIHCNYNAYLPKDKTEEKLYAAFRRVVCVSDYTAKVFTERYPSLIQNTMAIHNVIDTSRIVKMSDEPLDDTRFLHKGIIILSVGRFSTVKRFREIPLMASKIKSNGIEFLWYVIGPDDGSGELQLFNANVTKYEVEDCVIWLGGKSNPYPYFKKSDLFVCLSESEACPMVFKEAELLGTPIVTTDFPSAYELINDNNGIISPIENLAESIIFLLDKVKNGFVLRNKTDKTNINSIEKISELFDCL